MTTDSSNEKSIVPEQLDGGRLLCLRRRAADGLAAALLTFLLLLVTSIAQAATTYSWTGSASALWSNPNNWNPMGIPASGDSVAFPEGAANLTNTNDLPPGTVLANVIFNGFGYTIGGNGIVLTNAISGSGLLNLPIDVQANTISMTYANIGGVLSGTGPITVTGSVQFAGSHTYSGTLSGKSGRAGEFQTIYLSGAALPNALVSNIYLLQLLGYGTVGGISSAGGLYISPGAYANGAGTGILNAGNLNFSGGTQIAMSIDGPLEGTGYDQINVAGTVTLGDAILTLTLGGSFVPTLGQSYVLINNDGADAVSGTFSGLPEGATITLNGYQFQLSYQGGDGNDVTLTSISGTPAGVTSLTTSLNPSTYGQSVTFTATVTGSTPTGMVTFKDQANVLCAAVPLVAAQAQCTTSELAVGNRPIVAVYSGDALNAGNTSLVLTQAVNPVGAGDVWWDVFWRKDDGTNSIWQFTGPGPTEFAAAFPPGVPTTWEARFTRDVDGNGVPDVVWFEPSTGQVAVWLMSSPATIGSASFPASVGAGSSWVLSAVGDVNGDGRADLVWRDGGTGQTLVWLMSPAGAVAGTLDLGVVPLSYALRGVGDFNGDGIGDLLWFQASDGQVAVWLMAANGTHTAAFPGAVGPGTWLPYRVGDFDGDGKADLFWRDAASGMTVVWYMNGGTIADFDFFVSVPLAEWELGSVGDFDLDGRADLMWHAPGNGNVARWMMEGRHIAPTIELLPGVGTGWQMVQ